MADMRTSTGQDNRNFIPGSSSDVGSELEGSSENLAKWSRTTDVFYSISPRTHGYIDYGYGAALFAAPYVAQFDETARMTSLSIGAMHTGLSLITNYPLGAARVVPFWLHGAIEFAMGLTMIAAPWLLGFAKKDKAATTFFVTSGASVLMLWTFTDYRGVHYKADANWERDVDFEMEDSSEDEDDELEAISMSESDASTGGDVANESERAS